MSAIRVYDSDGRPQWRVIDDGASPHRGMKGIKGATFENPVMGSHAVGESDRARLNRQTGEYKAREAEKARERRTRCGKTLSYIGEPCARTEGHKYDCKSSEALGTAAVDRAAERSVGRLTGPTPLERQEHRRAYQRDWQRERRAMGLRP